MLFARCQCQDKATASLLVKGFAHQPAGNLTRVFFAGGEQPNIRSAKRKRYAERLSFGDDNIRAARTGGLEQAERNRLSDRHNEQSSNLMRRVSERLQVLDATKEIRRLHNNGG